MNNGKRYTIIIAKTTAPTIIPVLEMKRRDRNETEAITINMAFSIYLNNNKDNSMLHIE